MDTRDLSFARLAPRDFELALDHATDLAQSGELGPAVDLLRMLALCNPSASEVWNALADCHDRASDPATAGALRAVGRMLSTDPL
jgi:Flp pilus assembly protein TadD